MSELYYPQKPVGQSLDLFEPPLGVPLTKAGCTKRTPPKKEPSDTPEASEAPRTAGALSRLAVTAKRKSRAQVRNPGRAADGPACLGCVHYEAIRRSDQTFTYTGSCGAREGRVVATNYCGACALYEFYRRRS
jgi:hypothetical protein